MPELRKQLVAYFDTFDEPFEADRLMRAGAKASARIPNRYGPAVVLGTAALVMVVIGGTSLFLGGSPGSMAPIEGITETPATTVPVATTVPPDRDPRDLDRALMSVDVESQLACLPLDASGWSRSDPLPLLDEPSASTLTANGVAAVVIGYELDVGGVVTDGVLAYWSRDGIDWQPVEDFPHHGPQGRTPPAVAGGPHGFVATVNTPRLGEGKSVPIVAHSSDGRRWERVSTEALPDSEVLWLSDVYAGPAGFLITGHERRGHDRVGLLLWSSPDGRTWSASTLPGTDSDLPGIVATSTGWRALGISRITGQPVIWSSGDGVSWETAVSQDAPPSGRWGHLKPSPMSMDGDTWVLTNGFHEWGDPTVWISRDQGGTWNETALGGEFSSYEHSSWDIEFAPFGLLLTGKHDLGADDANLIHWSVDGTSWHHCGTSPKRTPGGSASSAFTEVATLGESLILLDNDTGRLHTWNDPAARP